MIKAKSKPKIKQTKVVVAFFEHAGYISEEKGTGRVVCTCLVAVKVPLVWHKAPVHTVSSSKKCKVYDNPTTKRP